MWKAGLHFIATPDTSMLLRTAYISKNTYVLLPKVTHVVQWLVAKAYYGLKYIQSCTVALYPSGSPFSHTSSVTHLSASSGLNKSNICPAAVRLWFYNLVMLA